MRHKRLLTGIIGCMFMLSVVGLAQNKFVGSKFCMACHKGGKGGNAYTVWEKSAHANAYKTLTGEAAKKIAKSKGLKTAPAENEACLKCHVTGGGGAKNVEVSFKKSEGVGCEACHGAASGYKMIHSKGDMAKSKSAGLTIPEQNDKGCVTCHNAESPTHKDFKFKEMWAKIAHAKSTKR